MMILSMSGNDPVHPRNGRSRASGKEPMRLFYAITLPEPAKEALAGFSACLRDLAEKGRFTDRDNFHLTLAFLGEVSPDRLEQACEAMRPVSCEAFLLSFSGIGHFTRGTRQIWWVGVDPSESLSRMQARLADAVRHAGFALPDQPYRPHLTLGRDILPKPGADPRSLAGVLPALSMRVDAISLMESARVNGRLAYTPLRTHRLDG